MSALAVQRWIPVAAIGLALTAAGSEAGETGAWQVVKSQHVLVLHTGDEAFAEKVAARAETYYDTIAGDLGFTRRSGFWLWENRMRILIYPTVEAFRTASNAPDWAIGRASSRHREIAGCREDGESFLATVLPHEMAHLILAEFIGAERLPVWLAEGLAQWEQSGRPRRPTAAGPWFTVKDLMAMDVRQEKDGARAHVYYMQCASLVGFLVSSGGGDRFGRFCRALRDGKDVPAALASTYPDMARTLDDLEKAWRASLGR